jgi:hypothetical protein
MICGSSTYHIRTIRVRGKLVMQGGCFWLVGLVGHDDKGFTLLYQGAGLRYMGIYVGLFMLFSHSGR